MGLFVRSCLWRSGNIVCQLFWKKNVDSFETVNGTFRFDLILPLLSLPSAELEILIKDTQH